MNKSKEPKDSVLYCEELKKFLSRDKKTNQLVLKDYTKPKKASVLRKMLDSIPHSREKYPETEKLYHEELTKERFNALVILKAKRSMTIDTSN